MLLLLLLGGACSRGAEEQLLIQARALGEERRWLEARELAKAYLRDHPEDVAGHFLLGQSFLHLPDDDAYEVVARGEFLSAYRIYERTGELGILSDMSEVEFRSLYHLEMAQTYLRIVLRAVNAGVPERALATQIQAALGHVDQGLEYRPDFAFLQEMKETLEPMLEGLVQPGPPRTLPGPPLPAEIGPVL